MKPQLIVSRYNENLSWLNEWNDIFDIIVYNKGNDNIDEFKSVKLPNYGREAHTYLTHIVNNYHSLSDITVFIQGKLDDLENWVYHNLNDYVLSAETNGYGANSIGVIIKDSWKLNLLDDEKYKKEIEKGTFRLSDISLKDYMIKYVGHIPDIAPVSLKGCFSVRRDLILRRDKNFYLNLLDSIPNHHSPEEAHYLERMWAYIFTENIIG